MSIRKDRAQNAGLTEAGDRKQTIPLSYFGFLIGYIR